MPDRHRPTGPGSVPLDATDAAELVEAPGSSISAGSAALWATSSGICEESCPMGGQGF